MATFNVEVVELELPAGRCVRLAKWTDPQGVPVRFALTTGYQSDRDTWQHTDRGIEISPRIAADVARALAELAGPGNP